MNLSKFTDYSFRILIYLANDYNLSNVEELSKKLNISQNHIKKIVHSLAKEGYILSLKGRSGGIKLAKPPKDINLGDVLIFCEDFSKVVECKKNSTYCTYNNEKCLIKDIVQSSTKKFIQEFTKYTLEDVIKKIND
ncbi:Rrf2 family transcriptional regulator [uncultured Tyzzerella sp.]|uniref:RrF2 family transcriptional regulator n=1 Tax=uncultured Tyzzerella sp. TaxID=2321398 RepID=UPI0029438442|nr:Rrf2 family transcriptional regulator [uncultured Tyzzerella sp.]